MEENSKILRLRVLLCFLKSNAEDCTVTGISRTLGEEKYSVSRAVSSLEKDGYINRDDVRNPIITEKGYIAAQKYSERLEITLNHLLYEGVDIQSAKRDAFYWALYCTDSTMEAIRATEERYRVKYELRDRKQFGGSLLCKKLADGCYSFPFLIFREHIKNGSNLSMANEGFEHPCTLYVKDGVGTVRLRSVSLSAKSRLSGNLISGTVKNIRYFDSGRFVSAESNGGIFSFPADALQFVGVGSGVGQILHGSLCLQMECSAGPIHMPASEAIFTILI